MKINVELEDGYVVGVHTELHPHYKVYEVTEEQYKLLCDNLGRIDINFHIDNRLIDNKEKIDRLIDLKDWFDHYYTEHEQKYRRLDYFYHDGTINVETTTAHKNLVELYHQAEEYRKEIQELEEELL